MMMKKKVSNMRVIFMGTPEFAVPTLDALATTHDVVAVVTQPDRPSGRGNKLTPPPVKVAAQNYHIPVLQYEKINTEEAKQALIALQAEVIVVVAYGQILKPWLLELPKYGCINVHASVLPRWRGAAPIHWAIVSGDTQSGVTIMQMDVGLDTGDMLNVVKVDILPETTYQSLHDTLKMEGAFALLETLEQMEQGSLTPLKQDASESTYASMLSRDMAKIDWNKGSKEIVDLIRGFNPWPAAFTTYEGERLKIYRATSEICQVKNEIGSILSVQKDYFDVQASDGIVRVYEIQGMGSKKMSVAAYILGHTLLEGTILGAM
jgi:methionyl-tRNA formyltransferase